MTIASKDARGQVNRVRVALAGMALGAMLALPATASALQAPTDRPCPSPAGAVIPTSGGGLGPVHKEPLGPPGPLVHPAAEDVGDAVVSLTGCQPSGGGPTVPETQPQEAAAPSPAAPVAAPVSTLSGASIRIGCLVKKGKKAQRLIRCKRAGAPKRAIELRFNASASTTAQLKVTQEPRPKSKKTKRARARTILTRSLQASQGGNQFVLPLKRARAGYVVTVTLTLPGSKKPAAQLKSVVRA